MASVMRKNMKALVIGLLLFISPYSQAFQCEEDYSPKKAFKKAETVFVARIKSLEFYKDVKDGKHAKLLLVKYDVVETLKGNKHRAGEALDLAGIGTGFVGFIPGGYYIIAYEKQKQIEGKQYVDMCDVLARAFYLEEERFSKALKYMRKNN